MKDTSIPSCIRNGLTLRVLDDETEACIDERNHGHRYSNIQRGVVLQALSLDFLTSTHSRGIRSWPCC